MADIELVIKIDEEYYKNIKDDAKKFLSKGMKVPSLYEIVIKGTPLPKGHWILDETDNSITCNKCGCLIWANDINNGEAHYCPNCGAEMKGEN